MLKQVEKDAPLKRNVTIDEVGDAALFALSDLGRGVTGETFFVDAGYHTVGAPGVEEGGYFGGSFEYQVVPEPSSVVLCGAGAVGLLVAVRRRKA